MSDEDTGDSFKYFIEFSVKNNLNNKKIEPKTTNLNFDHFWPPWGPKSE